jgi:hypothetical protein
VAIEIQTLIFCGEIAEHGGGITDLLRAPAFRMGPPNHQYPCSLVLNYYVLLRKEADETEIPFTVEFEFRNPDGHLVDPPGALQRQANFPAGDRFFAILGQTNPSFPAPDVYTVTLRVESEGGETSCRYDIDLV